MNKNYQKLGTLPYLGKQKEIFLDPKQIRNFRVWGDKFFVNKEMASDTKQIYKYFDEFCKDNLTKIIQREIPVLIRKKIWVELPYSDGKKTFKQKVHLSVQEYLKLIGYSNKLDFEIGNYEREWGINEIKSKQKQFILYFNLNLVKYDNGRKIRYVVAHELAHIFFRDHERDFQKALEQLYPEKRLAENFWNGGFARIFGQQSYFLWYILLGLFCLILVYAAGSQFVAWLQGLFVQSPKVQSGF